MKYKNTLKALLLLSFLILSPLLFAQQSSGFAPSEGVSIHYQTFGTGSPILIINGGPGFSSEGFISLAKRLSTNHTTILYDQRGTGKSTMLNLDSNTITMDLMTTDIERLRTHLGYESWVVLGHSFGGMMANYYASKHPQRVEAIIASSSGGIDLHLLGNAGRGVSDNLNAQQNDSLNYWREQIRLGDTSYTARLGMARSMAPAYIFNDQYAPTIAKRLTQGNLSLNRLVWNNLIAIEYDCKEVLKAYQKPVLILQGKNDIIPVELALRAEAVFPQATLLLLDSCGHYGWLDRPRAYFSAIDPFLAQIPKHSNTAQVTTVIKRYLNAIYQTDTGLLKTFVDSSLHKSGYYFSPKSVDWSYAPMSYADLHQTIKTYNAKKWIPQWAPKEIEIFDVQEKTASAKLKAIWGIDYMLLKKSISGWTISNVLWQSYAPKERSLYFKLLQAQQDNDATANVDLKRQDRAMFKGTLSANNQILYYSELVSKGKYRLMEHRQIEGHWSSGKPVFPKDTLFSNLYPACSPDGSTMVFTSYRPVSGWPKQAYLWKTEKNKKQKWSKPEFLHKLNTPGLYHSNTAFSNDGNLIFRVDDFDKGLTSTMCFNINNLTENTQVFEPIEQWKDSLDNRYVWGGVPAPNSAYVLLEISELNTDGSRKPATLWISKKLENKWTFPKPLGLGINNAGSWSGGMFFDATGTWLYYIEDFKTLKKIRTDAFNVG